MKSKKIILGIFLSGIVVISSQANVFDRVKGTLSKAYKKVALDIEKVGGVISKVGVKVGNATIKEITKAGDVVVNVAGKAGSVVLKVGQAMVDSTGMTLLNTGGMIWALTKGDLDAFSDCAKAVHSSSRYGLSTVIDEALKTVGAIDHIIMVKNVSIEVSSAFALKGRTPKFSIEGSFWGKDFSLKEVQLDLTSPISFARDLIKKILKPEVS